MTEQRRGRLGEIVNLTANLAVLASLVFVVFEIRQNSASLEQNRQSLDASVQLSIAAALAEVASRQVENADLADVIVRVFTGTPDPEAPFGVAGVSLVEGTRFMAWIGEWTSILYATWELKNSGVVAEDFWEIHASAFAAFLAYPWVRQIWIQTVFSHPEEFVDDLSRRVDELEAAASVPVDQGS